MTSTNCFEMRCPSCRAEDQIDIQATVWVRLTSDGTDADAADNNGHEWGNDSLASCSACGHAGTVKTFTPDTPADPDTQEREAHAKAVRASAKATPLGPINRPGNEAAVMHEETGIDYETCLIMCNMD